MVFSLRSSVLPLLDPLHKDFTRFFLRDLVICIHSHNFVEALLLFLFWVFWFQYIVCKDFRIPQDLNHRTRMFRCEYSFRQCSGNVAEEFLLFLMSFFLSLHEALHEGFMSSCSRRRRHFFNRGTAFRLSARISFQFFLRRIGFRDDILSREQ